MESNEYKSSNIDHLIVLYQLPLNITITRVFLNLKGQEIGYEGMEALSTKGFIKFNESLISLIMNLQGNEIQDDGLAIFSEKVLKTQRKLQKLKLILINNELTKEGLLAFSQKGLFHLPDLISLYLDLNWNEIGDEGLISLILCLNRKLVNFYLNLEWNEISIKGLKQLIYKGFKGLNYLTKFQLVLTNNNIKENDVKIAENLIQKITKTRLAMVLMLNVLTKKLEKLPNMLIIDIINIYLEK